MDPETLAEIAIGAPVAAGVIEAAKIAGLPERLAGVASVVFGIAVASLMVDDPTSRETILQGTIMGLTATGMYEGVKTGIRTFAGGDQADAAND